VTPLTLEEIRYWEQRAHAAFERLKLPQFRKLICKQRDCIERTMCQRPWECEVDKK
jgi:hypothetical protein